MRRGQDGNTTTPEQRYSPCREREREHIHKRRQHTSERTKKAQSERKGEKADIRGDKNAKGCEREKEKADAREKGEIERVCVCLCA